MSSKPIKIEDFMKQGSARDDIEEMAVDQFLIDEGLELLNAYRSISDPDMRKTVRQLMERLSATYKKQN